MDVIKAGRRTSFNYEWEFLGGCYRENKLVIYGGRHGNVKINDLRIFVVGNLGISNDHECVLKDNMTRILKNANHGTDIFADVEIYCYFNNKEHKFFAHSLFLKHFAPKLYDRIVYTKRINTTIEAIEYTKEIRLDSSPHYVFLVLKFIYGLK